MGLTSTGAPGWRRLYRPVYMEEMGSKDVKECTAQAAHQPCSTSLRRQDGKVYVAPSTL